MGYADGEIDKETEQKHNNGMIEVLVAFIYPVGFQFWWTTLSIGQSCKNSAYARWTRGTASPITVPAQLDLPETPWFLKCNLSSNHANRVIITLKGAQYACKMTRKTRFGNRESATGPQKTITPEMSQVI